MQKVPLKERLQKAGMEKPNFLKVFDYYVQAYFEGLSEGYDNSYFNEFYNRNLKKYDNPKRPLVMTEMVHMAYNLPNKEEKAKLLYGLLVEPYVLQNEKTEEEKTNA